ncbi:hypothetical protein [Tabrizicola sp.]|uniref:hypothetical protein n=1 Tax=Tabrizicola sp. TaxID=2005166 RepID=UPI0027324B14|nr:hypothetical protein [Tabrizicola sp.]MDP3194545.1 hypothetical protein [Tabrizicola sp.]
MSVLALASVVCFAGMVYPFKPFRRRWIALVSLLACFVLVGVLAPKNAPTQIAAPDPNPRPWSATEDDGKFWVTSERLNRRTCPSNSCGVVGQFFFREGTSVLERRDGWARVTKSYDASCVNGRSQYVDTGNASCDPANGIIDGQFAEWVSAEYLSDVRPPDPAAGAAGIEALVAGSDDFARHRVAFAEAAQSLIAQGRCKDQDFRDMGGWLKSSNHRNQPIYFTYCGGSTVANRLYLNADTGEVFR